MTAATSPEKQLAENGSGKGLRRSRRAYNPRRWATESWGVHRVWPRRWPVSGARVYVVNTIPKTNDERFSYMAFTSCDGIGILEVS